MVSCKVGEISVFIKNPNNNPGNYCKSLSHETDEMAGPLNPEWHSEILVEILVSVPLEFWIVQYFWHHEMIHQLYLLYLCIYSSHVITPLVNSSMYSYVMHRQVERMVTLNLFIESH